MPSAPGGRCWTLVESHQARKAHESPVSWQYSVAQGKDGPFPRRAPHRREQHFPRIAIAAQLAVQSIAVCSPSLAQCLWSPVLPCAAAHRLLRRWNMHEATSARTCQPSASDTTAAHGQGLHRKMSLGVRLSPRCLRLDLRRDTGVRTSGKEGIGDWNMHTGSSATSAIPGKHD